MGLWSSRDGHDGFQGGLGWVVAAPTNGECEGMAGLG